MAVWNASPLHTHTLPNTPSSRTQRLLARCSAFPVVLLYSASACLGIFLLFSSRLILSTFPTSNSEERSGWPPNCHHLSLHRALCAISHHGSQAHVGIGSFCARADHVA